MLERWWARAKEIGLDREAIERTFDQELSVTPGAAEARTVSTWQVDRAVSAAASHFDRRDAIQAVAGLLSEGAPGAEVERMADAYLASEAVIQIAESAKGTRFTTRRIWELEREALVAVKRMLEQEPTPAGELAAARVIHARPSLKADQREMIRRLLTKPEGVVVVLGEAGTGKTYAIVAAAEGWAQGSVLLIDEAGMVDSATLARLVSHAEAAEAKLVLLGDPEQLGEIEAGGLYRAIADRSDPVWLDEVIRHEHDLDRDAAKRIREGEGREALTLYRSAERVTISPDAEARREAMVRDWLESFERGEDAVMVAKRNAEVEKLNAMARQVRKQEGKLDTQEIEVGESRFAAGDQVITRINDRHLDIYNRERWRVAEVDAEQKRITLEGIDQAKRVEVGAEYLSRTNPHSDAPALEHAYAVTTYSAQGSTVDRAYVMADPSMDKQEFYVAASRARGETYLYATPEVQTHREEIAPHSPYQREGIPHIAEAAQRDRAQRAAHDIVQIEALPTSELIERQDTLGPQAVHERMNERHRAQQQKRIEQQAEFLAGMDAQRKQARELPRKLRHSELERIDRIEASTRRSLARMEAELRQMPPVEHAARHELAVAEQVLDERLQAAVLAARLAPSTYFTRELGERPLDRTKQRAWDRGVVEIEGYRQRHGIKDPNRAFGRESARGIEQQAVLRRIHEAQRVLGLGQHASRQRDLGRSLGIGR
jgi:AAA domain-containing protein